MKIITQHIERLYITCPYEDLDATFKHAEALQQERGYRWVQSGPKEIGRREYDHSVFEVILERIVEEIANDPV